MLGFHLSSSNFQSPLYTYLGGRTFLCNGEKVPICTFCGEYMIQLLSLNQNSMPLSGLMFSKGVSRLFICNSLTCSSYQDTESVQAIILQGNTPLTTVQDRACSSILLQEKAICSQTLMYEGDEENYPIVLTKNSKHTEIVFTPNAVCVDLKFTRNGKFYGIDSIILMDHPQQLTIAEVTMSKRSSHKELLLSPKRETSPERNNLMSIVPALQGRSITPPKRKAPAPPRKDAIRNHRGRSITPPARVSVPHVPNAPRVSRKKIERVARELSFTPTTIPKESNRRIVLQRSSSGSPPRKNLFPTHRIIREMSVSPKLTTRPIKKNRSPSPKKSGFAQTTERKSSISPKEQKCMFESESEFSETEVNLADMMQCPTKTRILPPQERTPPRIRKPVPNSSINRGNRQTSFVDLVKAAEKAEEASLLNVKINAKTVSPMKKAPTEKKTAVPFVVHEWVQVIDTKRIKHEERKEKKRIARETWQKYQNTKSDILLPEKTEEQKKNGVSRTASIPKATK